jgi:hypothetical protein
VKKIPDPHLRVDVLERIAKIIYTKDSSKGNNTVAWAQEKV